MTEIERRRTFAIISHPDAGKTTLTEKFLLFGGQIQVAGAVKSNKIRKTYCRRFGHHCCGFGQRCRNANAQANGGLPNAQHSRDNLYQ